MGKNKKPKFYAVAVGRTPGIYLTWSDCESQVKGFTNAKFKSFPTRKEAELFAYGKSDNNANREMKVPTEQTKKRGIQQVNNSIKSPARVSSAANVGTTNARFSDFGMEMYFDGGSRGNPGVSGAGCLLRIFDGQSSKLAISMRKYVGDRATNNQAEYEGLLLGLKKALSISMGRSANGEKTDFEFLIKGDSQLLINQMTGRFACNSPSIRGLYQDAIDACQKLRKIGVKTNFEHVYREHNNEADALANEAMDDRNTWTTYDGNSALEHSNSNFDRAGMPKKLKPAKGNDIIDLSIDDDELISKASHDGTLNIEEDSADRLQREV